MNVAIVMPLAVQRGGAELMLMYLLQANQQGPQIPYGIAFLEDGPMRAQAEALGYPVRIFPAGRLRQAHRYVQTVHNLHRWFRRERVQIAMSWMAKAQLYAGPAARLARIPSVWWQHGMPNGHWMDRCATFLPAQAIFCCSQAVQRAQHKLSPVRATQVVHPAIDMERFSTDCLPAPEQVRKQLGLPVNGPVVGMVARLEHWKGIHVFVDAAALVIRKYPEAHFVVVGGMHFSEPAYPSLLSEQAHRAGVGQQVHFVGFQRNVAEWVQAMDVLVHASVEPEPFGMVILEGMALGKPVVATAAGGPLEIISDGKDGLLVRPNGAETLASAVNYLLSDEGVRRRLGNEGRLRVRQFSTDRLAHEVAQKVAEVAT